METIYVVLCVLFPFTLLAGFLSPDKTGKKDHVHTWQ